MQAALGANRPRWVLVCWPRVGHCSNMARDAPRCHGLGARQAQEQLSLPDLDQLCGKGGSIPGSVSSRANTGVQGRTDGGTSGSMLTHRFHGMVLRLRSCRSNRLRPGSRGLPSLLPLLSHDEGTVTYFASEVGELPGSGGGAGCPASGRAGATCHGLEISALHLRCFSFLVKVKATDADEGVNGRVWYRIVKGKSRCPFAPRCICTRLWPAARTAPLRSPSSQTFPPPLSQTSALGLIARG